MIIVLLSHHPPGVSLEVGLEGYPHFLLPLMKESNMIRSLLTVKLASILRIYSSALPYRLQKLAM